MFRRIVSLATIGAFVLSSTSCSLHTSAPVSGAVAAQQGERIRVKAILMKSGRRIEFSRGAATEFTNNRIVASGAKATIRLTDADVDRMDAGSGSSQLLTKDGSEYTGTVGQRKADSFLFVATRVSVPASDVEMVWVESLSGVRVFLLVVGGAAVVLLGAVAIAMASKQSCPFVYSFDGDHYTLDGEPYGGATAPGLKRTDWGLLKYVKEVGGEYRFKITNEVNETQYTDELKLIVVDHPPTVSVVANEYGVLHSVTSPLPPTKAVDTHGRDILSYVNDDDWVYWQSAERDLDPELKAGPKERLVFEFPKPTGSKRVKLVFDGGNTLWASQMVKRFLSLYGRNLGDYYASLSAPGPTLFGVQAWNLREELYRMNLRVSTTNGWVTKGSVAGGGPFVTRSKLYSLDIADVPGDVLRIELTPPFGFWTINHLAVDYSEDVPLQVKEISAARAVDARGVDIRPLLAAADKSYFAMPNTGDSADLVFQAPPRASGLARSVILKTNGYYDIHMGTLGDPQPDMVAKIMTEPGFPVRYALAEYAKWLAEQHGPITR